MSSTEHTGAVLSERHLHPCPSTWPTDLMVQQYSTEGGAGEDGEKAGRSWDGIFFSGAQLVISLYPKAEGLITRVILSPSECNYRCGLIG